MRAIYQPLAHNRGLYFHDRGDRFDRTLSEIDACQRLINLKRARMTGLRIDMVPVVEAERNVTVFLHLEYHDAVAERMDDTSIDEDTLLARGRETGEMIVRRLV